MKFEVVSLIISSIVGVLSIGASIWVLVLQSRNSKDIENIKFGLSKKSKIFEDKYTKTMEALEMMVLFRKTSTMVFAYLTELHYLIITDKVVSHTLEDYKNYLDVRNNFITLVVYSKYWLGDELVDNIEKMNDSSKEICSNLYSVHELLKYELMKCPEGTDLIYPGILEHTDFPKIFKNITMLSKKVSECCLEFEEKCIERYQEH